MKWHLPEFTIASIADEDSNHPIRVEVDLDIWEHADLEDELKGEGWRPLSIAQYMVDLHGTTHASQRFSSIWVRDGAFEYLTGWVAGTAHPGDEIMDDIDDWAQDGFRLISIEASTAGDLGGRRRASVLDRLRQRRNRNRRNLGFYARARERGRGG
jgi:hypothetical protein